MKLLESVGAGVKAVAASLAPAGNTPFSNWGTGLMGSSSASGYLGPGAVSGQGDIGVSTATGSRDDYSADVGDISLNGVVSAAVSAIAEAFCAAPFVLEQFDGQNWNRVDSHPCIELLHNPNPHYGREQLWEAEIAGELITGNGYMRAVWNQARTQPVELWHESLVAPVFDLHHFIGSYRIFVDGRPYPLAAAALFGKDDDPMRGARIDHALHFRYRLNRRNPRFGETPLISVFPAIAGDNVASTWQTAVLKNGAGASFFITTKEGADIHPKKMEELLSQVERRLRREGAGRVAGTNLPVDFHKTSFSPDELALDKLPAHYEARICAALKVPPMILGLGAGDDHKTYSNFGESVDDFWQRNIIPFQNRKGAELEAQLFPLFEMDKSEWRIGFDRSQIAALQDDEGALYERVTKAVAGGWMQPKEAREKAKLPALEEEDEGEETDDEIKARRNKTRSKGRGNPKSKAKAPYEKWITVNGRHIHLSGKNNADAWAKHLWTPWANSLSKDQKVAIVKWTGFSSPPSKPLHEYYYQAINEEERGTSRRYKGQKEVRALAQNLQRALSSASAPQDTQSFRGDSASNLRVALGNQPMAPGSQFELSGFIASSGSRQRAIEYAADHKKSVLYAITNPKGSKVAYINSVSGEQQEYLQHNPKLEIVRVGRHKGHLLIEAKIV